MTDARKIWEAWGQASALYTAWAAENNVNSYRLFVLYALDGQEQATQKKVAEQTGLSKQTVNTVIRSLKAEGYVALLPGTEDRREKIVGLTTAGRAYSARILAPLYALEGAVVSLIGAERMERMKNDIRLFTTVFEKEMENRSDAHE